MKNRSEKWKEVWELKGLEAGEDELALKDLLVIDGYNTAQGTMTEDRWMKAIEMVKKELKLKKDDYLLEVGCGAGAMLLPLSKIGIKVAGIDYSTSSIEVAKKVIPNLIVQTAEACKLPFRDNEFDAILSFSVFFYFPDYEYAERVLLEMLRVSRNGAKILIADIPDLSKKEMSERYRRKSLSKEKYNQLYSEYPHLYYSKKWFRNFVERRGLFVKVFDQNIGGYGNSKFRFNVLITK